MGCRDATPGTAVYRPRYPRASPLYRCIRGHHEELLAGDGLRRDIERQVLERFVDCGDLQNEPMDAGLSVGCAGAAPGA